MGPSGRASSSCHISLSSRCRFMVSSPPPSSAGAAALLEITLSGLLQRTLSVLKSLINDGAVPCDALVLETVAQQFSLPLQLGGLVGPDEFGERGDEAEHLLAGAKRCVGHAAQWIKRVAHVLVEGNGHGQHAWLVTLICVYPPLRRDAG